VDTNVEQILHGVLEREGWPIYTVHPNDKGGPTKGGITLRTLEGWRQRRCTRAELQRLTEDEALAILRRRYAEASGIPRVDDLNLRTQLIDSAVLSGPLLAAKDLQRVLDVTVDGIIGAQTLAAIKRDGVTVVARRMAVARTLRLARHVQQNPDQLVFLTGWLSRSLSFLD
jgi:lysozyme family protein